MSLLPEFVTNKVIVAWKIDGDCTFVTQDYDLNTHEQLIYRNHFAVWNFGRLNSLACFQYPVHDGEYELNRWAGLEGNEKIWVAQDKELFHFLMPAEMKRELSQGLDFEWWKSINWSVTTRFPHMHKYGNMWRFPEFVDYQGLAGL